MQNLTFVALLYYNYQDCKSIQVLTLKKPSLTSGYVWRLQLATEVLFTAVAMETLQAQVNIKVNALYTISAPQGSTCCIKE